MQKTYLIKNLSKIYQKIRKQTTQLKNRLKTLTDSVTKRGPIAHTPSDLHVLSVEVTHDTADAPSPFSGSVNT